MRACDNHIDDGGMANFLNDLPLEAQRCRSWLDAGDVRALSVLNRHCFISRSFNALSLDEHGVITKTGRDLTNEAIELAHAPYPRSLLYPRVYSTQHEIRTGDSYRMEYVPLPTLAELYLYWPRERGTWEHITTTLLQRLHDLHWAPSSWTMPPHDLANRAEEMYVHNVTTRYADPSRWPAPHEGGGVVTFNGERLLAGLPLTRVVRDVGRSLVGSLMLSQQGLLHGDPNFTNVLWNLETSTFRLVDPRGAWGGRGSCGDITYDVAKVAYSPIFARIVHGLFDLTQHDDGVWSGSELNTDPVIDDVCGGFAHPERLRKLVALLLFSGASLHEGDEATIMYLTAARMLQEWI
jgi:hypothetical protein